MEPIYAFVMGPLLGITACMSVDS